ncbi:MAG: hypothetical protein A2V66_03095 [Ignavibacteria bacterium RBG_13_36_8]|nr:MAG: hypothetical protein A2V66_03095 [Ignavibacteria bacterium RBG_13_36_8]
MIKIKRILVPIDFSEVSERVVKYALFLAKQYKAKLTLLHAVVLFQEDAEEEKHMHAMEGIINAKESKRRKKIDIHIATSRKKGIKINSVMLRGFSAADVILDHIYANKYDLIVMGTHGRSGFAKWVFGSVAEKIVRHSPVPVVSLHKEFRKDVVNKVLIPIDFSKFSKHAVNTGTEIAKKFKAELTFLHSVEQEAHPEFYASYYDSILRINPRLEEKIITNMIKFTRIKPGKANYVVLEGKAHRQIQEYAKKKGVNLIVMATRGMGMLDDLLIGSNAERVVKIAHCPVLTVRGKK